MAAMVWVFGHGAYVAGEQPVQVPRGMRVGFMALPETALPQASG
jgi:hypothetical protein